MNTKELVEKLRAEAELPAPEAGFHDYDLPNDDKGDPCPFCGEPELMLTRKNCDAGWWYHVECVQCMARGPGVIEYRSTVGLLERIAPNSADDTEKAVREVILLWNSRRHTDFRPN